MFSAYGVHADSQTLRISTNTWKLLERENKSIETTGSGVGSVRASTCSAGDRNAESPKCDIRQ